MHGTLSRIETGTGFSHHPSRLLLCRFFWISIATSFTVKVPVLGGGNGATAEDVS
jgi:hypothetical protein